MRSLATALMLGWVALGCGGVATRSAQQEETGPNPPVHDNDLDRPPVVAPGLSQGGTSSGPGNQPTAGSATASSGGAPNVGAGGSFVGEGGDAAFLNCESPVTRALSPFEERVAEDATVAQQLAFASKALAGDWQGVVTTPWNAPYAVVASFGADGSYSSHCEHNSDFPDVDQGCCRAFYYGSDRDSSLKQWSLTSANADGTVDGDIDVAFCYPGEECYLPGWQGKLRKLQFNSTADRMRFEFWTDDGHGPIQFDLQRD